MKTELLPTLGGHVQGVVGKRPLGNGKHEFTLQCQRCGATETPKILVLMTFKFPECTIRNGNGRDRTRLCPECHVDTCDQTRARCREMITGRYYA